MERDRPPLPVLVSNRRPLKTDCNQTATGPGGVAASDCRAGIQSDLGRTSILPRPGERGEGGGAKGTAQGKAEGW